MFANYSSGGASVGVLLFSSGVTGISAKKTFLSYSFHRIYKPSFSRSLGGLRAPLLVPKFYLGTHLHAKFHFATRIEGRNTQDGTTGKEK